MCNVMLDSSEQVFKYRFVSKHKGLLWGLAFLVPGLGLTVYGIALNKGPILTDLSLLWSVVAPFVLLAIWKERTDQVELNEVKVSEDGIWAHLRKNHLEYLPRKNVQFIPWSSIESYQIFSRPDTDDFEWTGIDGVRLFKKDEDRKISIYRHIEKYELLLDLIKRKLSPG